MTGIVLLDWAVSATPAATDIVSVYVFSGPDAGNMNAVVVSTDAKAVAASAVPQRVVANIPKVKIPMTDLYIGMFALQSSAGVLSTSGGYYDIEIFA